MKELERNELLEINGGLGLFGYIAFAYLVDVATHLPDHIEAFKEGFNSTYDKN
jgi:hypothetical protein